MGDGLPAEAFRHYEAGVEVGRLDTGFSRLEFARTQEIVRRYLPVAPARIMDIGGGPGVYSSWLARAGYEVHLVDAMPLHVEQARTTSAQQPSTPIASMTVGDARSLDRPDGFADAVLLFGPLYHLTERTDRLAALSEARRVLQPDGRLLAVAISRFTSLLDGLTKRYLSDPQFAKIVEQDLANGQHRNPANHPSYFTTAYFHHPNELRDEIDSAGLRHEVTLAIEGPGWLLQDFDERWQNGARREQLLDAIRRVEAEPTLLGASAHIMAVARR